LSVEGGWGHDVSQGLDGRKRVRSHKIENISDQRAMPGLHVRLTEEPFPAFEARPLDLRSG
jgi:hypothetical protein